MLGLVELSSANASLAEKNFPFSLAQQSNVAVGNAGMRPLIDWAKAIQTGAEERKL